MVAAIFRRLERVLADREPDVAQRRFIESAPVLAAVAEASARGVVATGPRQGRRIIRIRGALADVDAFVMGKPCAQVEGTTSRLPRAFAQTIARGSSAWLATWRALRSPPPGCPSSTAAAWSYGSSEPGEMG